MFGKVPCCTFALLLSLAGCTTEWAAEGSYYRTTQTLLDVPKQLQAIYAAGQYVDGGRTHRSAHHGVAA